MESGSISMLRFIMNTKQYTKAGLEALLQKARGLNRELDKKFELFNSLKDVMEETAARFASLGEDAKANLRDSADWASRCAGHAVKCAECEHRTGLYSELAVKAATRKRNWVLWVEIPLLVLLLWRFVVDVANWFFL